jgi:Flp pilus assembly protein TadG
MNTGARTRSHNVVELRDTDIATRRRSPRPLRLQGDDGSALMEFSLVLPFLAIVVFGTIDLGRAFALRSRLTNMAREGAFYAQYHPDDVSGCTPSSITAAARAEDTGVTGATITVYNATTGAVVTNSCGGTTGGGVRIRVQVSEPMSIITPFVSTMVGNPVNVSSSSEVVTQG